MLEKGISSTTIIFVKTLPLNKKAQPFFPLPTSGDPSKAVQLVTNSQNSYRPPPSTVRTPYNKSEAVRAINGASIALTDCTTASREYFTTTTAHTFPSCPNPG